MVSLLGAAYAFGSNVTWQRMNMMGESVNLSNFIPRFMVPKNSVPEVWLLRYGPRMYAVCCKESSWLGKEAFSTIQVSLSGSWVMVQSWSSSPLWCLSTFTQKAMTGRNPSIRPGWADSNSRG